MHQFAHISIIVSHIENLSKKNNIFFFIFRVYLVTHYIIIGFGLCVLHSFLTSHSTCLPWFPLGYFWTLMYFIQVLHVFNKDQSYMHKLLMHRVTYHYLIVSKVWDVECWSNCASTYQWHNYIVLIFHAKLTLWIYLKIKREILII